ncbi:MAG TPA: hypothetical protein VGM06_25630 [Polyangiaceae bacterium]|jgi:membrane associated rhomboid family serine protease
MDSLLARLERRLGRYAIPNLIYYVVGGMAIVWVASVLRPSSLYRLAFDLDAVRQGQVWRLVTFLFAPIGQGYWALLSMYVSVWIGRSLEQYWGAFRFNVYYFLGALGAILAGVVAGDTTNLWLDTSLFLAFATLFPNESVSIFFLFPVRAKWLGIISAAWMAYRFVVGDTVSRVAMAAACLGYLIFFAAHWSKVLRERRGGVRQKALREQFQPVSPTHGQRVCAICGAREADGADIRVCSCEKCGGQTRTLCLAHARNH